MSQSANYRDEGATAAAFSGPWFHTGDLAVLHPDGYMEIRGRAKDVIISGGENISAIEVEHALVEHPAVVEAAVIGIPDERWGELVRAHVIVRAARPPAADELIAFLRSRLAGYKIPRTYVFETDLPRTATGKVQKFRLRAEQDASRAAQGAFQ